MPGGAYPITVLPLAAVLIEELLVRLVPGAAAHGTGFLESSLWQSAEDFAVDVASADKKEVEYESAVVKGEVVTVLPMAVDKPRLSVFAGKLMLLREEDARLELA